MKTKCPERRHVRYNTKAEAERDMEDLIAKEKKAGNDRWQQLNVFRCDGHWHVGHNPRKKIIPTAAPEKRPPTLEKIKRKIRMMEREWTRQQKARADLLGRLVEIDRQLGLID